jgi:hypothetical protein
MSASHISDQNIELWHDQMVKALRFGKMLEGFPSMVEQCLVHGTWGRRFARDLGRTFDSPLEYFTYHEPDGVGTTEDQVVRLIRGTPAEELWRKATVNPQGAHHYNIMMKEARQGTSRAYTLVRLKTEAPHLHAAVCAGELSANAAAIQAGFRKKPTAFETVRKLLPKLSPEERFELMQMLRNNQTVDRKAG